MSTPDIPPSPEVLAQKARVDRTTLSEYESRITDAVMNFTLAHKGEPIIEQLSAARIRNVALTDARPEKTIFEDHRGIHVCLNIENQDSWSHILSTAIAFGAIRREISADQMIELVRRSFTIEIDEEVDGADWFSERLWEQGAFWLDVAAGEDPIIEFVEGLKSQVDDPNE